MTHYLFNFTDGDKEQATGLLQAKMWRIGPDERYRDELASGDVALIYVPAPEAQFIARVVVATGTRPGDPSNGVSLSLVEEWDPPVPMDAVVHRIDPTGSNPLVQANAAAGFRTGVVRITADEYEAVLALRRTRRT